MQKNAYRKSKVLLPLGAMLMIILASDMRSARSERTPCTSPDVTASRRAMCAACRVDSRAAARTKERIKIREERNDAIEKALILREGGQTTENFQGRDEVRW